MGKKVLNWSLIQVGNITTTMNAKTQLKSLSLLLLRFNNKPTKLFEIFCFRWVERNREQILNMNKVIQYLNTEGQCLKRQYSMKRL